MRRACARFGNQQRQNFGGRQAPVAPGQLQDGNGGRHAAIGRMDRHGRTPHMRRDLALVAGKPLGANVVQRLRQHGRSVSDRLASNTLPIPEQ